MKIRQVESELFLCERTDRHDEANNSCLSQFCENAYKLIIQNCNFSCCFVWV